MALTDKLTAIADAIRAQSGKTAKLTLDQMPSEILDLQPLSFEVKGGTSAPTSPKENTIWMYGEQVHAWDFSATEPYRRSKTKNRLCYPFYHTTMTENGITFTDNGDGTVTANGTATAQARFRPSHNTASAGLIWLEPGTYTVSGCPAGGSSTTYYLQAYDNDNDVTLANCTGNGKTFTLTKGTHVRFNILVEKGQTLSNAVYKPQLEKGTTATSFVKGDASGQAWFLTAASSPVEFNALKKNGIMVYPLSAKQFSDGKWIDRTAKSYLGGAWKDWATYLYDSGNEFTDLTGGWVAANRSSSYTTTSGTQVTKNADNIYAKNIEGGSRTAATTNQIDLTPFKELHVIFSGKKAGIGVASSLPYSSPTAKIDVDGDSTHSTKTKAVLDISAVNSAQRIFVGDGNVVGIYIYKVWLQ